MRKTFNDPVLESRIYFRILQPVLFINVVQIKAFFNDFISAPLSRNHDRISATPKKYG